MQMDTAVGFSKAAFKFRRLSRNGSLIAPCLSFSLFSLSLSPSAADLGWVLQASEVGATLPHVVPWFDLLICPHATSLAFNQPPVVPRNWVNKHTDTEASALK